MTIEETVEYEKCSITNERAIEILSRVTLTYEVGKVTVTQAEIQKALAMAIKALEKDIAKEPVQTHKRYGQGYEYDDYYCPECDMCLAYEPQGDRYKQEGGWSRCINCGQRIKWESDTE